MCVFARHDLTRDPPFSRLDLIVCRNVLIYLDVALQKRLISMFHYALKAARVPDARAGGDARSRRAVFTLVDKKWRLFRKAPARTSRCPLTARPSRWPACTPPGPSGGRPLPPDGKSVQDEATRMILDRYGPPGVVVDENFEIVQFRGHTGAVSGGGVRRAEPERPQDGARRPAPSRCARRCSRRSAARGAVRKEGVQHPAQRRRGRTSPSRSSRS